MFYCLQNTPILVDLLRETSSAGTSVSVSSITPEAAALLYQLEAEVIEEVYAATSMAVVGPTKEVLTNPVLGVMVDTSPPILTAFRSQIKSPYSFLITS